MNKNFKIPRPPNAFMIFSRENRNQLRLNYPNDSNQEISIRLGSEWRNLVPEEKAIYYQKAKELDLKHREMYPGYVYKPRRTSNHMKQKKDHPHLPKKMTNQPKSLPQASESVIKVIISQSDVNNRNQYGKTHYINKTSNSKNVVFMPYNTTTVKYNASTQTDNLITGASCKSTEATEEEKNAWLAFINNFSQSKEQPVNFENNQGNLSPITTRQFGTSQIIQNINPEQHFLFPLALYPSTPFIFCSPMSFNSNS